MKYSELILEALSNKQKDIVDDWGETRAPINISAHVIPKGTDRIVIPLKDPSDESPHPAVANHLISNGYSISSYRDGKAKDKYGRDVNIGKILNKTNAHKDVITAFNSDPNRSNKRLHDDMQVVISRHPYDVAGMSTGQSWTSCLDMDCGINRKLLPHEVHEGTHVAYLTKKGDDTAKAPLARIALKPYREEKTGRQILVPEHKIYGNAVGAFEHTVNEWTNTHFPLKDNTFYTKSSKVYDDSNQPVVAKASTITPDKLQHSLIQSKSAPSVEERAAHDRRVTFVLKHGTDAHRDQIFNHPGTNKRLIAEYGTDAHRDKLMSHDDSRVRAAVALFGNDKHRLALSDDHDSLVRAAIREHANKKGA